MNELLPVEWNGRAIRRREDGYFNATDMCQACDRQFHGWHRNDSTDAFLKALSAETQIHVSELVQAVKGGDTKLQGTWVHPDVATALAMWCSPEFHVFVVGLVRKWAEGKLIPAPVEEDRSHLLARALIEAYKEIEENREDATAFRRIAPSSGSQNLTDTAKLLRMKRDDLIKWMHEHRWIYRRMGNKEWVGYDSHTKNGDLEHVLQEIPGRDGTLRMVEQVRVAMKGIAKLTKIFANAAA